MSIGKTYAQPAKSVSEKSYRKARQVLDTGIYALGGRENFGKIQNISLKFQTQEFDQGQSANPSAAYYVRQTEGLRFIDFRGERSYQESKTNFLGGNGYWGRRVSKRDSGFTLDLGSRVAYPVASSALPGRSRSVQRWLPHSILEAAYNRSSTLRSLGDENYEGQLNHVICFADGGGDQIALYFDARTNLLTKYEMLSDDPVLGDVLWEVVFSDYREIGGIKMPFKAVDRYGGEVIASQIHTEIKINSSIDDSIFEIPKDAKTGREVGGTPSPTVTKLAQGVYFVNGISGGGDVWFYSQLFVAFEDYILVVESPLNNGVSQTIIAKIKELIPGKPIRYLVPTHYHTDHLGGIRGYIAEGSIIVATPGNQSFIEKIAAIPHTISPDMLSSNWKKPLIETFTGKRVFTDSQHTVELYDVGVTPHVDEMVVVYLPREKILFVSDLMMTRIQGSFPAPSAVDSYLAEKIRQLDLSIETIANGHGWIGKMETFRKSLVKSEGIKVHGK